MLDPTKPKLALPVDADDHAKGAPDAAVTLVEYGDYECPTCANALPILDRLLEDLDGKLRVVFRHFPLHSVHAHAGVAAEAAECAAAQGKFWPMHRLLFEHQNELAEMDMTQLALRAELDVYKFDHDLMNHTYESRVSSIRGFGEKAGVAGTPALFLNGTRYVGSIHALSIRQSIEALLENPT